MTEKSSPDPRLAGFDAAYPAIRSAIERAAREAGRDPGEILLLAATKTVPVEVINHAVRAGITCIGENRVQELKEKAPFLDPGVTRHFIGHLQTNKVKEVVPLVSMIHSVSSLHLAEEISKQCVRLGKTMEVLIEINIGGEESKSGFAPEEAAEAVCEIAKLPALRVMGLMAIPPVCTENEKNFQYFEKMYQLFLDIGAKNCDNVSMVYLSMGMTDDFDQAILCGANIVRIGSGLFGARNYKKEI